MIYNEAQWNSSELIICLFTRPFDCENELFSKRKLTMQKKTEYLFTYSHFRRLTYRKNQLKKNVEMEK